MAQGEEGAGTGAAPEPGSEAEPEVRARPDSAAAPVSLPDLAARLHAKAAGGRVLAALIGAPGSGKSHMAEALAAAVQALGRPAAVLPMDGFHYDDAVLEARGLRPRKGAPETFDAEGLAHLLDRLRRNDAAEIAVPLFDRALEISRAGARIIGREVEVVMCFS